VRIRAPRLGQPPRLWLPALLAALLVAAKLAGFDSEELDRLHGGLSRLRDALARAAEPGAHRPPLLRVELGKQARRDLDAHVERSLALGAIPHGEDDWVPAKLAIDGRRSRAWVRLKGDFTDHLEKGISLRVKLRGDARLWGMRTFNLQHPSTRYYLNEYAFIEAARREGLLAPLHEFVRFAADDEAARPYLLIEHFAKELLERQGRREGVIVKFDESDLFGGKLEKRARFGRGVALRNRPEDAPLSVIGEGSVEESPELSLQRELALERFDAFRHGRVPASELFDVEALARWLALSELFGAHHGLDFHNPRYYYDPVRGRFEPFAWDGNAAPCWPEQYEAWYAKHGRFAVERFFADPLVGRAYARELWRMTEPAFVEELLRALEPALAARAEFLLDDPEFRGAARARTNFGWVPAHARWIRERLRAEAPAVAWLEPGPGGAATLFVRTRARHGLELAGLRGAAGAELSPVLRSGDPPWNLLPLPPHPKSRRAAPVAAFRLPAGLAPLRELVVRVAGVPQAGAWTLPVGARAEDAGGAPEPDAGGAPLAPVALRALPGGLVLAGEPPAPELPRGWSLRGRRASCGRPLPAARAASRATSCCRRASGCGSRRGRPCARRPGWRSSCTGRSSSWAGPRRRWRSPPRRGTPGRGSSCSRPGARRGSPTRASPGSSRAPERSARAARASCRREASSSPSRTCWPPTWPSRTSGPRTR
jgi:hypothetical protein